MRYPSSFTAWTSIVSIAFFNQFLKIGVCVMGSLIRMDEGTICFFEPSVFLQLLEGVRCKVHGDAV
ncbi:hypothetical protein SAMN05518846_109187 [Brevibacillus centrosporus]|uniref:Uncharacterized protein n=1 Tax=Brevibacillus centrosporus TaxID=54910 RepID=A0A1I3XDL2_9BACL|nr:hypothetical protein SAMN05518846_109187 [Brevibacillus centrosporus]